MGVRIRIVELLHRYSVNLVLSDQTGELPRRLSLQRTEAPQRCMPEAVTLPRHAPPVDGATSGGRWGRLGRPGRSGRGSPPQAGSDRRGGSRKWTPPPRGVAWGSLRVPAISQRPEHSRCAVARNPAQACGGGGSGV